jgi:cellulose synthase/poly-beta-1,6-N-acetylglucosamine synthase-like glycosyltransferase
VSFEPLLAATFWAGLSGAVYAYVMFPVLAAYVGRRSRSMSAEDARDVVPKETITVIIPAYNEERSLEAKLRNVLASTYPRQLLDIIVVSDASTDATDAIARRFAADGVRLIVQPTRRGKTAGLNQALDAAHGSIVLFTDANAEYRPDTIGTLAQYFHNSDLGLVTGYTNYVVGGRGEVAIATNAYTVIERAIRSAESRWGCCVGADGAIFAMRRSLYHPLRADDINDFVLPLSVIEQGYRCVFAGDVFCTEHAGATLETEFRRQSRITNRTLRAIWRHARLLNPLRFPGCAFFLFSHKVVRFLVPLFLIVSAASLALLTATSPFWWIVAIAAGSGLGLTMLSRAIAYAQPGYVRVPRLFRYADVFLTINVAVLHGWWKFLSGRSDVTWQHDRSPA